MKITCLTATAGLFVASLDGVIVWLKIGALLAPLLVATLQGLPPLLDARRRRRRQKRRAP